MTPRPEQNLYVAATRARREPRLHVTTEHTLGLDAERPPASDTEAADQLALIIIREDDGLAATGVQRSNQLVTRGRAGGAPAGGKSDERGLTISCPLAAAAVGRS